MNPDNLIDPFIVYWDIHPSGYDDAAVSKVCDELIKSKIFVLNLRDLSVPVSAVVTSIAEKLAVTNIRTRLTVRHDALESAAIKILRDRKISIFTETDSADRLQAVADSLAGGVSFPVSNRNFHEIPAVISCCINKRITELEFPIQRNGENDMYCPGPEEVDRLSRALKSMSLQGLKMMIHDPLLWKVCFNKDRPEGMGCNGAFTMIYISPALDVTPCPLLPHSMGSLRTGTLKEIYSSCERRQIRTELSLPPQECRKCAVVDDCKGGCRGRTYVLRGAFDKKDPACRKDPSGA
ncbi:MAG: SPASM domain-containing protein [Nitrospirae bacterium]|nr:SPASM domain-containing protein [Nitrospirota bacterium]